MVDEPGISDAGNTLGSLADGGWMNIPGAAKAIFRLVTSVGNVGAEWLEVGGAKAQQMKDMIASDTKAKTAINAALAKVAAEMAVADPTVVERSMRRWIGEEARKQENRERVAQKAATELENDPPPVDTPGPSEDWLNHFGPYAEKASSATVQLLWGKVLAGEIRKPGSISFSTLHFLSILDAKTAKIIEEVLPFVVNEDFIPKDQSIEGGLNIGQLIKVAGTAFGDFGAGMLRRVLFPDDNNRVFFRKGDRGVILTFVNSESVSIPALLLSSVGSEIDKIIPSENRLYEMASGFWSLSPVRVQKGMVVDLPDGSSQYQFLQDVPQP